MAELDPGVKELDEELLEDVLKGGRTTLEITKDGVDKLDTNTKRLDDNSWRKSFLPLPKLRSVIMGSNAKLELKRQMETGKHRGKNDN